MKVKSKGIKLQPKKYDVPSYTKRNSRIETMIFLEVMGIIVLTAIIFKLIFN